eukprot:6440952-Amphidinium_carterae.3
MLRKCHAAGSQAASSSQQEAASCMPSSVVAPTTDPGIVKVRSKHCLLRAKSAFQAKGHVVEPSFVLAAAMVIVDLAWKSSEHPRFCRLHRHYYKGSNSKASGWFVRAWNLSPWERKSDIIRAKKYLRKRQLRMETQL